MLGFTSINPPIPTLHRINFFPHFPFKSKTHKIPQVLSSRFVRFAQNPNPNNKEQEKQRLNGSSNGDELKKDRQPLFNLKWGDIFDPNPDNLFAVGLTGLLAWASVQVLWQLTFISLAILVAALKYSFIAALLLFILITLL